MGMLTRQLAYADKRFHISRLSNEIGDDRRRPRHKAGVVARSLVLMEMLRLGSLNLLVRTGTGSLRTWINGKLPSADTLGRAAESLHADDIRRHVLHTYFVMRRGKNIRAIRGHRPLVLDGHELFCSDRRHCPHCQTRTIKTRNGERTQYYHRCVMAMLVHANGCILLDAELQRPGEDEMAAAMRILMRLLQTCRQAFDLVCGDALYMNPSLWKLVQSYGIDVLAVVKNENRDLYKDAEEIFAEQIPLQAKRGTNTTALYWDAEGFTTWPQVGRPVRIVKSIETTTVRRQLTKQPEEVKTTWMWATTLSAQRASTQQIVQIGHGRWCIENQGYNELVNSWHANHCYRHNANAMIVLLLLLCLAYNIFHAMLSFNLKPQARARFTIGDIIALTQAEFRLLAGQLHPP